ncbi:MULTISPECIES: Ger(x)C family spore germination protein [Peribacillus]|jgi:spore germination protein KC|uniref:Spore germination protein B3 n=1 Tax=Peribacillus simplex TaxID=1478 RepID=A0A9W4KVG9_9BACI|nr:Ger(x)C family spore germination protein [Peribacillus simplex]MDR4925316.1 Ger(x)C family spore germination protein [Peribacillus simplex]WHX90003.1 Ger(x)C family spore germination protein [Peribacillus simplex]CAH0203649.1 Spore germination protein B3 [Peribacillus simplex]
MRKLIAVMVIGCQLLLTTGCWGMKEIQAQTYGSALGIDYKEGEFILYFQALNFADIAKQEGANALQQKSSVVIGEGKGESIEEAYTELEQNAALPLYIGHINTFILSKSVIKNKMKDFIEYVGKEPLLRYNSWLFVTDVDIKKLFDSDSFFNLPNLFTIIQRPESVINENYFISPLKFSELVSKFYQPVGSILIPSLVINEHHYSEGGKEKKIPTLNGGYVLSNQQYKGFVSKQDLIGLKWVENKATVIFFSLNEQKVSVEIRDPKTNIMVLEQQKKPLYDLEVRANGILKQNIDNFDMGKIEKKVEIKVKEDILKTLETGEKINTDLFNISEKAYRYHVNKWDNKIINSFDKTSINNIKVKIHIEHSENYKR